MLRRLCTCLLLAAACSRGGSGLPFDDDAGVLPTPDGGAADLAAADLAPAPAGFLVPSWVTTIQGSTVLWGPYVAALPSGGETGEPQVLVSFTKGNAAPKITIGAGDPGEGELSGVFKPALVWLSGRDGRVQRVRQVAGDQSDVQRASVLSQARPAVTATGAVWTGGQFHGTALFFPGTASATTQSTETRLLNGTQERAEDPYFVRYGVDGQPDRFLRGRTPGPLTKTWFNYGTGVAALADGGMAMTGAFEDSGFVVGDGRPGAVTLAGPRGTYVAALTAQHAVSYVVRNSGPLTLFRGLRAAPDGSVYLLAGNLGGSVLAADTDKVSYPAVAGQNSTGLIKLSPTGRVRWVRRLVSSSNEAPADFIVTNDGRVVVSGNADLDLTLRSDGDKVDATLPGSGPRGYVAAWDGDGALQWLRPLGPEAGWAGSLAARPGGELLLLATSVGSATMLPLDRGGPARLPEGLDPMASVPLLYRLSATGERVAVAPLGVNLPAASLAVLDDGRVAVGGVYGDWQTDIRVGASDGTRALPPCPPNQDQRAFVVVVRPR